MVHVFVNPKLYYAEATIAVDASGELEVKLERNGTLKYMFIKADGSKPTKSTCTIMVKNQPITKDKVLANTLGSSIQDAVEFNIPMREGDSVKVGVTNKEGAEKLFTLEVLVDEG